MIIDNIASTAATPIRGLEPRLGVQMDLRLGRGPHCDWEWDRVPCVRSALCRKSERPLWVGAAVAGVVAAAFAQNQIIYQRAGSVIWQLPA